MNARTPLPRENPIVQHFKGDKDRAIEWLSEACARLQEQLERERARQSSGYVYRGRPSARPPKKLPEPLAAFEGGR